jgi:hypothetical protein
MTVKDKRGLQRRETPLLNKCNRIQYSLQQSNNGVIEELEIDNSYKNLGQVIYYINDVQDTKVIQIAERWAVYHKPTDESHRTTEMSAVVCKRPIQ